MGLYVELFNRIERLILGFFDPFRCRKQSPPFRIRSHCTLFLKAFEETRAQVEAL